MHSQFFCTASITLNECREFFFKAEPLKSRYAWMFEHKCPNLADWRWQTLLNVLEHCLPRIHPLRLVWRKEVFAGASRDLENQGVDDAVQLDLVNRAITDQFFGHTGKCCGMFRA